LSSHRRATRGAHFLKSEVGILLHALQLLFELAVPVLQFFNHARQLPDLVLEPAQTCDEFGVVASTLRLPEQLSELNVPRSK
jgi:hypothetical protein